MPCTSALRDARTRASVDGGRVLVLGLVLSDVVAGGPREEGRRAVLEGPAAGVEERERDDGGVPFA